MTINRWIGQAVPVQEVKYYVPRNVAAGVRYQLSDGVRRNGYTYPSIPPESDTTPEDRALRVVNAIVAAANGTAGFVVELLIH